jgi:peptidoglycan/xylan/chitin deacetylase (PgdA/CDA1 family)
MDQISLAGLNALDRGTLEHRILAGDRTPGCYICFDDGWRGTFEVAGPLLERRGTTALAFVTANFVGRPLFADAPTLRKAAEGPFTIGCHGRSHRMLSSLSLPEIRAELYESRDRIEQWIGRAVDIVSIPGGATSQVVREEARAAGFSMVFDSTVGLNPTRHGVWGIGRIGVTETTDDATFSRWLTGNLRPEARRKTLLSLPKAVLGMRNYSRLRRLLLGERGKSGEHVFTP